MKRHIIALITLTLLGCNSRNSTGEKAIESKEYITTSTNIANDSTPTSNPYDFIEIDSVKINGVLSFSTTKDSLLKYLHGNLEVTKESEGCSSYGSNNDTLEYLNFTDHKVRYVYFNNKALFSSIHFDSSESYLSINGYIISKNTTIESLAEKFPNSCKNFRELKETEEVRLKFRPQHDFFDDSEFWIMTFKNNRIESIEFIVTC